MQITVNGNYFMILPDDEKEASLLRHRLMGWRQRKNNPLIIAEDNIVNRIVLDLSTDFLHTKTHVDPQVDSRLKTYQVSDVQKMCNLAHCLNANPMGLGKTVETIETLEALNAQSICIVAPKIIRHQWKDQLYKWWGREAIIFEKQSSLERGNIYIVNYDKLRNEKTLMKFKAFRWDVLVIDEAHKIKSRDSKQTVAVKQIPSAKRLALTGTPILKYVDDLWSLLHFFGDMYSGKSYWSFVYYFCKVAKTPWGDKIVGTTDDPFRQTILRVILEQIMIRHHVEVAQGKVVETVRLPMTKKQRDLYRKEKQLLLDQLPENCTIANGAVLSIRLRQTTSWPGMFIEDEPGPKFEWILETCQNNPSESFTIFTVFEQTAEALKRYLFGNGISAVTITGKNKEAVNQDSKQIFLKKGAQVLIGTIGAMGQGYDELQAVSRIAIFVDRDWSPEINNQAEERLHRMGQKHLVQVIYLECSASFDQHVGKINANKAEGIRQALENESE